MALERPAGRTLTRRGWTLLGACLGLFVAGRLLGTVELSILATAGVVLLLLALRWVRTRSPELIARRDLRPARLHVDADGRVDLALSNRSPHRTAQLSVTDIFDDGQRAARFLLPPLPAGETARAAYRIPTTRRGRYRVGPLAVAATDPFGLARRIWTLGATEEVTVCPRVHDILAPSQPGGRLLASAESLRARALVSEAGDEFLTLREYEVGDDLRRVHWRSTARTGELMVRQDEAQWRARAVVVLDVRPQAHDAESFEVAVEATASVVERLTRMGRRVDVVTSGGQPLGKVRPGYTRSWSVINQLATIEAAGPDRLGSVLSALRVHDRPALVVAVMGTTTAEELGVLGGLTAHGAVTVVATRPPVRVPSGDRTRPGTPAGTSLVLVDTYAVPFPIAWNETMTRWHLAALTSSPRSRSLR